MNRISVPNINFHDAKEKHRAFGRLDKFLAHEHTCRSNFIKSVLNLRQHGICPNCGKHINLTYAIVHHLSYDIYCQHLSFKNPEIKIYDPRSSNNFYSYCPNCELCYFTPGLQNQSKRCLSNLALICSKSCHDKLHEKQICQD